MHVQIHPSKDKPGFITVVPHGPIDSDTYKEFHEKLKPFLVSSTKNMLFDLADVDYISSAGLSVFFEVKRYLMQCHGDVLFCNLKPQIKRLFEVIKALPPQTLFETTAEADAYLYRIMNEEIDKHKNKG